MCRGRIGNCSVLDAWGHHQTDVADSAGTPTRNQASTQQKKGLHQLRPRVQRQTTTHPWPHHRWTRGQLGEDRPHRNVRMNTIGGWRRGPNQSGQGSRLGSASFPAGGRFTDETRAAEAAAVGPIRAPLDAGPGDPSARPSAPCPCITGIAQQGAPGAAHASQLGWEGGWVALHSEPASRMPRAPSRRDSWHGRLTSFRVRRAR